MLNMGRMCVGLVLLSLVAMAQAGSYTQNFNSIAEGSSNLGDGSTIVSYVGDEINVTNVYYNGTSWRALRMTEDGVGETQAAYAMPQLDTGSTVTEFTVTFSLLITYNGGGEEWDVPADGFSFNFGTVNLDSLQGMECERGLYTGEGEMLSVSWETFTYAVPSIRVLVNGEEIASEEDYLPIIEDSIDGASFQSVTIHWDSNGLDVTYGANTIYTDLDVSGFAPTEGDIFAFAARTGACYENVFLDNVSIITMPEPLTIGLLATCSLTLLQRKNRK
ncbi:MAG TPA: hypothetical protein PKK48_07085 [Phycisphaerae bacterium]|nr:hypothetical protein [Phycisphaerae bacterium]HPS53432.1 hypothetical protein [Phycisphaerae bacterium]